MPFRVGDDGEVEGARARPRRRRLDLFANLRPVTSPPGSGAVDLLVVRENTEGLYAGRQRAAPGRAVAERVVTEHASRRIARVAGEQASARRRRVCVVHKANVLRETCGLFRAACLDELARFDVEVEELLVDHAAYRLAAEPERFDVLVTTNLFGDVLSDLAAHAGGGLGLASSSNLGESHALFEPVHGSAPDLAGRGVANPLATLRACASLLEHLALDTARTLARAIELVLAEGPRTADLGGSASTREVTEAVLATLRGVRSSSSRAGPT